MPEENNGENLEVTPEMVAELKAKLSEAEQQRDNVVGEIKEDREKRQALQEQVENLQNALTEATQTNANTHTPPEGVDVAAIAAEAVKKVLGEEKEATAKSNRVAAIEKFVSQNKMFSSENDPTGKLREALVNKISMFNTSGLTTVEQFYQVVSDAASLLGVNTTSTNEDDQVVTPYSSQSPSSATPRISNQDGLNDKEMKLIQQNGMTAERYIALKASNPDFIADLLDKVK